jgi:hypothetical protein
MYTKYTDDVYTGEVYRVYFAIPRLSEDFLGIFVASSKLIQMLTDCKSIWSWSIYELNTPVSSKVHSKLHTI